MATQVSASLPGTFGQDGNGGTTAQCADTITEYTPGHGVAIIKPLSVTGAIVASGAISGTAISGTTLTTSGAITPTAGIGPAGGLLAPTVFHSGGLAPSTTTTGTDTTPVNTETYLVEVYVENNCTLTGVSLLNGSAVAGNVTVGMFDSAGNPIAGAKSASTAQSGTGAYQKTPFAVPYAALGPAKYFIGVQFDTNTTPRYRSHILGNFGAAKKTGETYGTFTAVTPPTTFTTNLGPIADTY